MKNKELLPCPFCGGAPDGMTSSDGFTSIGCLHCNPVFGVMIQGQTEAEAIAAWNTRAERTCKPTENSHGYMKCCSECGRSLIETAKTLFNYCPHCGAKVVDTDD